MKDILVAYLLWFFLGVFGVHRFYLNRPCSGVLYLFTLGVFGIGWLVDICLIPGMVEHENEHCHAHTNTVVVVGQQPAGIVAQPYQAQPMYQAQPYPGQPIYAQPQAGLYPVPGEYVQPYQPSGPQ
ncbi:hypothetical protein SAMD00019534_086730 [Acytostelium subglobosum LB1]|uniref:hypothetical protein n=1 Tax=Acytostelium subglobosum LB1 TaxID=1410327 RepID=UPI000644D9FD|nr:hypothetical protein SAMD00019534_086730 [Acytostelium subglobosum LB1]GAM25498.1 hypothetical protein SAMD00019534_086730 [Acytostelium subglobosum LB1]|eukprot:XP_012751484.1 hypothetical protein SAMD00019534_086730 [Acytostelium subglobosum LB1]